MLSVRADRPHVRDVPYEDFFHLAPGGCRTAGSLPRSLQRRRWVALVELVNAFRIRDENTWRHCRRVHQHVLALAGWLRLTRAEARAAGMAALLHDVGKIAVSDALLRKEERLSEEEFSTIRLHPVIGERLVFPLLDNEAVLGGIRYHHERYDGQGYPDGLAGSKIPLAARLIAVADIFDALTNSRPYRKEPLSRTAALEILERQSYGQLDPDLTLAFVRMLRSTDETVIEQLPVLFKEPTPRHQTVELE
jgi:HD-GYP domain-containing protein (c-di-GMP phosphodiesterase class II)